MSFNISEDTLYNSRLLVVDDSAITRRKLITDLKSANFSRITEADSAEKALEILETETFDLLLVDMLMPGMDGNELVKILRADEKYNKTPIIVVTVSEEKDLVKRCFDLGANDFLRKPWDVIDLAARVKAHLERHYALQALSISENRFSQAMQASRDGLWEVDLNTNESYFSPGFYRMIGYKLGAFPPNFKEWKMRIHPDDVRRVDSVFDSVFSTGREFFDIEYRLQNANKSWVWVCCRGRIVERNQDNSPAKMIGVNEDITSHVMTQKTLQKYANEMEQLADQRAKALVHSERLATIGTMSAGIAHEINNPLSFISGNSQMMRKIWPDLDKFIRNHLTEDENAEKLSFISEQLPGIIESICTGVDRITLIVKNMKDFSRKEAEHMSSIDVVEPIESALLLCHNALKHNISIIKNYTPGQIFIPMRRQQIEQVLINLINNAVHAMEGSGKLYITAVSVGDYARIVIRDTGCGISAANLSKIFDPFFTTKPEGVGTGLGLSISKGIMEDHGGNIEATNNPEGGAEFTLMLPYHDNNLSEVADENEQLKILLVEDNENIKQKMIHNLKVTGGHLLLADNCYDAKRHLRFSRPDLILISMSGAGIEPLKELFDMRKSGNITIPFFVLSQEQAKNLEQKYNLSLKDVNVYPLLTSRTISEIYTTAINFKKSRKI